MKLYVLEIKRRLPSFNEYINACRKNKYVGAKMKKDIEYEIWLYIMQQLKGVKIENPVKIHFIWIEENGKRDLDNICFAKKFILDALVKAGVLQNDNRKHVSGFTDHFLYDKESKVLVEIEEE